MDISQFQNSWNKMVDFTDSCIFRKPEIIIVTVWQKSGHPRGQTVPTRPVFSIHGRHGTHPKCSNHDLLAYHGFYIPLSTRLMVDDGDRRWLSLDCKWKSRTREEESLSPAAGRKESGASVMCPINCTHQGFLDSRQDGGNTSRSRFTSRIQIAV